MQNNIPAKRKTLDEYVVQSDLRQALGKDNVRNVTSRTGADGVPVYLVNVPLRLMEDENGAFSAKLLADRLSQYGGMQNAESLRFEPADKSRIEQFEYTVIVPAANLSPAMQKDAAFFYHLDRVGIHPSRISRQRDGQKTDFYVLDVADDFSRSNFSILGVDPKKLGRQLKIDPITGKAVPGMAQIIVPAEATAAIISFKSINNEERLDHASLRAVSAEARTALAGNNVNNDERLDSRSASLLMATRRTQNM